MYNSKKTFNSTDILLIVILVVDVIVTVTVIISERSHSVSLFCHGGVADVS